MYGWTTFRSVCADGCVTLCVSVADGLALVTALFVTLCVSVALGPTVVPVATLPAGLEVVAVMPVVELPVTAPSAEPVDDVSTAPCSYVVAEPLVAV